MRNLLVKDLIAKVYLVDANFQTAVKTKKRKLWRGILPLDTVGTEVRKVDTSEADQSDAGSTFRWPLFHGDQDL